MNQLQIVSHFLIKRKSIYETDINGVPLASSDTFRYIDSFIEYTVTCGR